MPPVIDKVAKEFERVNGSKTITPEFEFDVSQVPTLIHFTFFYRRLDYLLSYENPQMQPLAEPLHTTPPPSTNPVDPQYSSTSNMTSSSNATSASAESKDEESSDSCVNDFIHATFEILRKSLKQMAWYKGTKQKLQEKCLSSGTGLTLRTKQKMEFELKKVMVTAWSDGGLALQPNPWSSRLHPVFPIEVFLLGLCPMERLIILRPNAKSMHSGTAKRYVKCMRHKSMPKC